MFTIELGVLDFIVFFILVAVLPLEARRRFRKLKTDLAAGRRRARLREYRRTLAEEWFLTAVVAAVWVFLGRGASTLGLVPEFDVPALIGYALTGIAIGLLVMQSRMVLKNVEQRDAARRQMASAEAIIPRNPEEKRVFRLLAITAGICEEFLYRGFLLAYFWSLLPDLPIWPGILLGGAAFGFAHLYQGWGGVLKTGALGVLMGGLYWLTGSIWAPIVLHSAIDLNSGGLGYRLLSEETGESPPSPGRLDVPAERRIGG